METLAASAVPFVPFLIELGAASSWIFLHAVWHTWFPRRVWLGQVKRPDVTSNPLVLPPSESPRNPQSSLGFSGYKPSFVCPLQHQAQPWCHGYLKGFNWPTIITHSFKKQPPLEEIFLCCSLGLSTFLPVPEPPNPNRTWSHTAGVFFLTFFFFFFSWIYFLSTFLAILGNNGTLYMSVLLKLSLATIVFTQCWLTRLQTGAR